VLGRRGSPLGYRITRFPITALLNTGHLKELSRLDMELLVDSGEPILQFVRCDYARGEFISETLDDNTSVSQAITSKVKSFIA
jgi:hypothetical protein